MALLIAIPLLGLMVIFQSAVLSQVRLLFGAADIVLLVLVAWAVQERVKTAWHWGIIAGLLVSLATAVPIPAVILAYLLVTGAAVILRRVFWARPLLAMVTATLAGTLLSHSVTLVALQLVNTRIPLVQSFNIITLPSILLNLLLAIPVYALISDLANWLHPQEIEI
jgi:rod shape-determining protein MreD